MNEKEELLTLSEAFLRSSIIPRVKDLQHNSSKMTNSRRKKFIRQSTFKENCNYVFLPYLLSQVIRFFGK